MTLQKKSMEELAIEFGLKKDEYQRLLSILNREPRLTELGIFSVMWSEHCSYKSSKVWLKTLPTEAPWVIQGPGENAGVIDIGDNQAIIFKMESHNHPSFIEPYQGAATGVGGIMRDVFTMGARPIANLNALRFGSPDHPKTRHLLAGVVAGIGGYGNCMGVPTVAGEVNFHPSYNGNILVNAMNVGLADADKIFYAKAVGVGNPVIYVGAKTGRDGIHGATMASQEFTAESEAKRPNVQIGDPFKEKLLLEACLELMAEDAIIAIQDMGAAGLTSSSVEMSSKGGLGIELDLDKVPLREEGMSAYEIMLSESQERMLMVLKPEAREKAQKIFAKWELDYAEIGKLTDTGHLVIYRHGQLECDIEVAPLVEQAPQYERPWVPTPKAKDLDARKIQPPLGIFESLKKLLSSPDGCSKRWVWEQYDHLVRGQTWQRPGGDAAIIGIPGSDHKAIAVTSDCTPRYCFADPIKGGMQAVVESWRNLTAVGAKPLAFTDNLNFGNPERPEIMGQIVGCIQGMREAALALDYPVVSGNVSLYNETNGQGILPTPVIGGVGVIADARQSANIAFKKPGDLICLLGHTSGHLGASLYLREICGKEEGDAPTIDLALERRLGDAVRQLIKEGIVTTCHDISDGGLLVAIAEMAIAGRMGAKLKASPASVPDFAFWFGEDQARYVLTLSPDHIGRLKDLPLLEIGLTGGEALTIDGIGQISIDELRQSHEAWLPGYMEE